MQERFTIWKALSCLTKWFFETFQKVEVVFEVCHEFSKKENDERFGLNKKKRQQIFLQLDFSI